MKLNFKMMLPVASAAVFLANTASASYDDAQMRNLENRVSALEQRKGSCGMINPSARPYTKDCFGIGVSADVLLWQANENGLGYVVQSTPGIAPIGGDQAVENGQILNPDFDWDWGFRIGLDYSMPHDGWDLFAEWTHFTTTANDSTTPPLGGTLFPVWQSPESTTFISEELTQASERWRLRLNVIDLELGREFFVSKWLTLRPHMGLRNAWVRQRYHVDYTAAAVVTQDHIKMRNRFWGIGLRGGMDSQWGLGCGWSLYGNLAIALLRGNFRVDQTEVVEPSDLSTPIFKDRLQLTRATTDLEFGIRWDQVFMCEAFRMMLQVGWEHHMFFGQNQLKNFMDDTFNGKFSQMNGDLAVHGWSAELRFDF
jgi:hypothetical protein